MDAFGINFDKINLGQREHLRVNQCLFGTNMLYVRVPYNKCKQKGEKHIVKTCHPSQKPSIQNMQCYTYISPS